MAPVTVDAHAPSLDSPDLYLNRELSWLAFNARVLAQARDASHPLLERVKFFAIVGTNLDEFFMIRVAALQKQIRASGERVSLDGLATQQQLAIVRERALAMLAEQGQVGGARSSRSSSARASRSWRRRTIRTPSPSTSPTTSARKSRRCSRRWRSTPAIRFRTSRI